MTWQLILSMTATTALALAPLTDAAAQGNFYCRGKLEAASFYTITHSTSTRSTVSYYLVLRSMVGENVNFAVIFHDPRVRSRQNGTQHRRLGPWGTSSPIELGVAELNNPGGAGGPAVPKDLAAGTRVMCH